MKSTMSLIFGQYCNIFENKIFCNIHSCNIPAQAQANVRITILNIYYTTFMDDTYVHIPSNDHITAMQPYSLHLCVYLLELA